jgi:hypothetical protein
MDVSVLLRGEDRSEKDNRYEAVTPHLYGENDRLVKEISHNYVQVRDSEHENKKNNDDYCQDFVQSSRYFFQAFIHFFPPR